MARILSSSSSASASGNWSRRSLLIVVALLVTAFSTQMTPVNGGRALRSDTLPMAGAGCDQVTDGGQSGGAAGIASFVASSSNSSSGDFSVSLRGLMFRLASGPSKRGPGH